MAKYLFVTTWKIDAPIEKVWQVIVNMEKWPDWWTSVKSVSKLSPGDRDENGIGSRWRFVYTSRLPYKLEFESKITQMEAPFILEGASRGELEGFGRWELAQEGSVTKIRYIWNVETTKRWMNLLEPVMRPLFSWNHNVTMQLCSETMAAYLGARLVSTVSHGTDPS